MEPKTRSELAGYLKNLIDDIGERMHKLKFFDKDAEINAHCDDLEVQVMHSFQSAIEHLNKTQDELLAEISKYRSSLLADSSVIEDSNLPIFNVQDLDEFKSLGFDICGFSSKTNEIIQTISSGSMEPADEMPLESTVNEIVNQALEYKNRIKDIGVTARRQAFKGRFMSFKHNQLFNVKNDHVGALVISDEEFPQRLEFGPLVAQTPDHVFWQYQDVTSLCYLSYGHLALATSQPEILICPSIPSRIIHKIPVGCKSIIEIVELPGRVLAGAGMDGTISVIGLTVKQSYTFKAHDNDIYSMKLLKSRNLASHSADNTIKIWHTDSLIGVRIDTLQLILTITVTNAWMCPIDILSNGYLVTCTYKGESIMRIWNPEDGKMVKEINTRMSKVVTLCVLSNDDVAIGSRDELKIVNLIDFSLSKTLFSHKCGVQHIYQLPNCCLLLVRGNNKPCLEFWNPENGQLIQVVDLGESYLSVIKFKLSWCYLPNLKQLAIQHFSKVLLWSLRIRRFKALF